MARLGIAKRRIPQDGRMTMQLSKHHAIDFSVSACPTLFSKKIVLRILDLTSDTLVLGVLGYEPNQKQLYLDALSKPYGMNLVIDSTGKRQDHVPLYRSQHP